MTKEKKNKREDNVINMDNMTWIIIYQLLVESYHDDMITLW